MPREIDFAVELAERIFPDEVDLVPDIFEAASVGGPEWNKLLEKRTGTVFGGATGFLCTANFPQALGWCRESGWN